MTIFLKDPAAVLDYSIDWAAGYLAGQSITASVWSVAPDEPGGIVIGAQRTAGGQTFAGLQGGLRGHVYRIINRVGFSDGGQDERTVLVRVEDR